MAGTNSNTGAILRPEEVADLVVRPVDQASVAVAASTVISTNASSTRIPVVTSDPSAGWVAEGAEIPLTDLGTTELDVVPRKLAALTVISRELSEDSSPAARETVGQAMARDMARKLDQAFYGNLGGNAPAGLEALTGTTTVDAGAAYADLDWAAEAVNVAEREGATISAFVAGPVDALALAQITDEDGSRRPLLGTDPTQPTRRTILGVPLLVSPAVTAGTVWGIPRDRAMIVRRADVRVEVSTDAYFSSDQVAVRGTMRASFGFPDEAALVKITRTAA